MNSTVDSVPHIRLLGGLSVRLGETVLIDQAWSRRKAAELIALLALQRERSMHREQVFDALWPELDPASAANNLHKNVHYLRTELEARGLATPLVTLSGGLAALDRAAIVDADAFRSSAKHALEARSNAAHYAVALDLYGGELLPAERYEPWTASAREEFTSLYHRLIIEASQLYELRNEWRLALECLARLGPAHTDEEAYRAEMRVYAMSGQQASALRTYERCRDSLKRELDVKPSRRTETLRSDIEHARVRRRTRIAHLPDDPLIGRSGEMTRLIGALDEASEGRGGLALVAGEPGIGKTRLAEELATHAHLRGAHVMWGRCDDADTVQAFWPWLQAIQTYIEEGGAGSEGGIALPGLGKADAAGGDAAGGDARPQNARVRLFESVTALLKLAADTRPVLLVLDDLHDADAASLQLLRYVAREAPSMRMLVLATFRDTEASGDHPLNAAIGELVREHLKVRIDLKGLSDDEVGRFVAMTVGTAPSSAVIAAIREETDGNPFFVKECAQLAVGGTAPASGFGVPPNARDAVLRRVDRLTADCRDALAVASVVGRRFERAPLLRVAGLNSAALLDALDEARRARVISSEPDTPDSFKFVHGLTHQAIYERIPRRRRAELHGLVGDSLEARGSTDADLPELAHHFVEAARGGGDAERAIGYCVRAGETAEAAFAWESAASHWETACRLMEEHNADRETLADLLERLELLLFNTGGDQSAVLRCLERALAIRTGLGQEERVAQIHSRLGRALSTHAGGNTDYTQYMNIPRALEHYRAAEPVLTHSDDKRALSWFYIGMAGTAFNAVSVADGVAACDRAIEITRALNDAVLLSTAILLKGGLLKISGRLKESLDYFQEAYDAADRENYPLGAFFAVTNMGDWTEGYHGGRGALLERELQQPRMASGPQRLGIQADLARMWCYCGEMERARKIATDLKDASLDALIAYFDGDWAAAERQLSENLDGLRAVGNRNSYANRIHFLAEIQCAAGDARAARRLLGDELAIGVDGGSKMIEMRAASALATIAAQAGDGDDARANVERCRAILAGGEDWGRKAGHAYVAEALLGRLEQRADESDVFLDRASSLFRERVLPWDEADAHVQMARLLERCGDAPGAEEQRNAATAIYRSIGAAAPWIERVGLAQ